MGSGGGTTVQKADPWSGAQPYLSRNYAGAESAVRSPPGYYPGQTFADPVPSQLAPFQYGFDYLSSVYGTPFGPANYMGPEGPAFGQDESLRPRAPVTSGPGYWDGRLPTRRAGGGGTYLDRATPTGSPELRSVETNEIVPSKPTPPFHMGDGVPRETQAGPSGTMPYYGLMAHQANRLLGGATPLGEFAGGLTPFAMGNLQSAFSGQQNMIGEPGASYRPSGVNLGFAPRGIDFGFQTPNLTQGINTPQLDVGRFDPNIVRQDINPALGEMLSGEGDYSRVQEAVRAGAQPTLDILREDIMPSLRSRTVASNNPTGEIKDLNRIVPRVMRDISNMGTQAALGEYNRAKSAQQFGANLAGQLGLQGYGQGLQGAATQAGLEQSSQGLLGDLRSRMAGLDFGSAEQQAGLDRFGQSLGLQAAQTQAGLDQALQSQLMGASQFDVGTGLEADIAQQGALNAFRGDTLGLGGLGLNAASGLSGDIMRGLAAYPSVIQQGMLPMQTLGQYGDFVSNYENAAVQEDMNRYNYYQNLPMNMQQYMSGILSGAGGLGGQTTMKGDSNPMLGAAGGAMAGGGLAMLLNSGSGAALASQPYLWPLLLGGAALGAFG